MSQENNTGEHFYDVSIGSLFKPDAKKPQTLKEKIYTHNYLKISKAYSLRHYERQATEPEKCLQCI